MLPLALAMLVLGQAASLRPWCDVVADFGAVGSNETEDTAAVSAALSACTTVSLPSGYTFLLRPVRILSNRQLLIHGDIAAWRDIPTWPNSTVKLCNTAAYQLNETLTVPRLQSLLWSMNSTNVTIGGHGTVDGQGWRWWPLRNDTSHGNYWHACRPNLVEFGDDSANDTMINGVTDLVVEDVTLLDAPHWTLSGRGLQNSRHARRKLPCPQRRRLCACIPAHVKPHCAERVLRMR
jgi:polygalacturonase